MQQAILKQTAATTLTPSQIQTNNLGLQGSRNQKGIDDTGKTTKTTKDGKKIKVKTIRVVSGNMIKEGILSKETIQNLQSIVLNGQFLQVP